MNLEKGDCIWLTGLPGAGKTTLAKKLLPALEKQGHKTEVLDGDYMRQSITSDLGFSREDRDKNIARIAQIAAILQRNGVTPICSFITPYREQRDYIRNTLDRVHIVHVDAPVEVCQERDPKGLYAKAKNGDIDNFTGVDAPYEKPVNPAVKIKTYELTPSESIQKILDKLSN